MFSNPDIIPESENDQIARERHERQQRRVNPAPSLKDIEQDTRIRLLERENRKLECYVTALVEVMRNAGIVGERQVQAIAAGSQWAQLQDGSGPRNPSPEWRHET
jgi:hypothetical protein